MVIDLKPSRVLVAAALLSSSVFADTQIVARECESGWTRIGYVLRPTTSSYIRKGHGVAHIAALRRGIEAIVHRRIG